MIHFALRRAAQHPLAGARRRQAARARAIKGQKPCVLWFTGLSGAGKSTIANLVEKRLPALGRHTYLLDGDNVRHGLNQDLGFTDADRVENIRRVARGRQADGRRRPDRARLVHLAVPQRAAHGARAGRRRASSSRSSSTRRSAVAESRDPKGLYRRRARASSRTSPASTAPTRRRRRRRSGSTPPRSRPRRRPRRSCSGCTSRGSSGRDPSPFGAGRSHMAEPA